MKFVMFPFEETRDVVLTGKVEGAKNPIQTATALNELEDKIGSYLGKEVVGIRTNVSQSRRGGNVENNKFRMLIEIVPKEKRDISANEFIAQLQESFKGLTGFKDLRFVKSRWGSDSGSPIEIWVQHNDDEKRLAIAEDLRSQLEKHPSIKQSDVNTPPSVPEYRIEIDHEKLKRLSISPSTITSTLRTILDGRVLYKFVKDDDEVFVRLTANKTAKTTIQEVLQTPIENNRDYLVPLSDLVTVQEIQANSNIERISLKRTTVVYADIKEKSGSTPLDIAVEFEKTVFPKILAHHPATTLSFAGEVMDSRESQSNFITAILLVLAAIYIILSILFNSMFKPLRIMIAIPFGVVGVIIAYYLHSKTLFGFYAIVGVLGMIGVVVNDAIVMLVKLDRSEDEMRKSTDMNRDVAKISQTRLRAILLTTLTTVAGVMPTAYGIGGFDAMLSDMMFSLSWGLTFGCLITLFLIPCLFRIEHDIKTLLTKIPKPSIMVLVIGVLSIASPLQAQTPLGLTDFIQKATQNDTQFEAILLDRLPLAYYKDSQLANRDWLFSLKGNYFLDSDTNQADPRGAVGLSKLFPQTGTEIGVSYEAQKIGSLESSEASLTFSQDIAQNAFGKSYRYVSELADIQIELSEIQILEAYEEYHGLT